MVKSGEFALVLFQQEVKPCQLCSQHWNPNCYLVLGENEQTG